MFRAEIHARHCLTADVWKTICHDKMLHHGFLIDITVKNCCLWWSLNGGVHASLVDICSKSTLVQSLIRPICRHWLDSPTNRFMTAEEWYHLAKCLVAFEALVAIFSVQSTLGIVTSHAFTEGLVKPAKGNNENWILASGRSTRYLFPIFWCWRVIAFCLF